MTASPQGIRVKSASGQVGPGQVGPGQLGLVYMLYGFMLVDGYTDTK